MRNLKLYNSWSNMKQRCDNPNRPDYKYYGQRGITYYSEWKDFQAFQKWALDNGWKPGLTLDRENGDLGYCPSNCRWISIAEQQLNKSNNVNVTYDGETKTLSEWARDYGIPRETLRSRIVKLGYTFDEAIHKKYGTEKTNRYIEYQGEMHTHTQFAKIAGCTNQWIYQLVKRGMTAEEIMIKTAKLRQQKER